MEKRLILFIVFCVVFIPTYMRMFMQPKTNPQNTPGQQQTGPQVPGDDRAGGNVGSGGPAGTQTPRNGSTPSVSSGNGATGSGEQTPEPAQVTPEFPARTFTLESPTLRLTIDTLGASVTEADLLEYREDDGEEILTLFGPDLLSGRAFIVDLIGREIDVPLEDLHWEVVSEVAGESVTFRYPLPESRAVTKTIRLPREGYEMFVEVAFEGEYPASSDVPYRLLGPERIRYDVTGYRDNARVVGLRNVRGEFSATDHESVDTLPGGVQFVNDPAVWIGLESNFFASVIRPTALAAPQGSKAVEVAASDESQVPSIPGGSKSGIQRYPYRVGYQSPVRAGATDVYAVFLGPKDPGVLEQYEEFGFQELIDYGSLGILVRLFLFLLRTFEAIVGSWGVAIILLTVLVKACLHPINKKNQRGMQRQQKKMAKVQPQMKAIKEKHKNDPLKANQEIQKLFREHGINPAQMAGGCLMLFLQLPIWIGLLSTFRIAIELRQAPFLYISDLTAPDALFGLGFRLPLLGGDTFNLLPILYVIVTLVNQKMMPKSDDPNVQQQQKMMSFMMVAFGFIFYNFASGLLLYFLTSASLGLIEQKIIRAELNREEEEGDGVVVKGPDVPPPPKPGKPVKRRS